MQKRIPMFASLLSLATVAVPTAPQMPKPDVIHAVQADPKSDGKQFTRETKVSHFQFLYARIPPERIRSALSSPVQTRPAQTQQRHTEQKPAVAVHLKWVPMMATWYDGEEGINGTGLGITKSGERVEAGVTIAVDPKVIPLGTWVEVKFSDGTTHRYKAEDIGGNINGSHIDIYDPSRTRCLENGIQQVFVERLG